MTYPSFTFRDEPVAPSAFVRLIKSAVAEMDFESDAFADWDRQLLRDGTIHGFEELIRRFDRLPQGRSAEWLAYQRFLMNIGQAVFSRIPVVELKQHVPYSNVEIVPVGREIVVKFRSLCRQGSPDGTIYYSRHRPTVEIDGIQRVVAFRRHAIERTCERLDPTGCWWDYAGVGDVFAYFDQCRYFERAKLHPSQLAFTFYDECPEGYWRHKYVDRVVRGSPDFDPSGTYYFRVGYCPANISGEFIVGRTLLFPGYVNTPEYGKVIEADLSVQEKESMTADATEQTAAYLLKKDDFSLVKWFHDNGVPQVIRLPQSAYVLEL